MSQKISQKDIVFDFLKTVSPTQSSLSVWEEFETANPGFNKKNYSFYRNQAINDGIYVQVKKRLVTDINTLKVFNEKELVVKTINLDTIDPAKFKAIPTGTPFDKIASKRLGIMPGTAYMITGESGAGKTTVSTNIADYLKENNEGYTAGFISGEMDENDWTEECLDNPRLADLETVFLLDYLDASNYVEILVESLSKWNFVILDSFEVVIDQLKDIKGWTAKKAEAELINMLRKAAAESNCTVLAIQQYTKGGTFVGSNKIKHLLTGMIFVRFDKHGDRYIEFVKNRRGGHMIGKHMYFTKNKETGRIEFDDLRFENDAALVSFNQDEATKIQEEVGIFDDLIMLQAEAAQKRREELLAI
jgi:predicted ATP-dependent serine protease